MSLLYFRWRNLFNPRQNMLITFATMLVAVFLVTFIITKVWRRIRQRHYELPAGSANVVHRWCVVDAFDQPTFCAVSGRGIIEGAYCESCGVYVSDDNAGTADRTLPCKEPAVSASNSQRHLWVRGNVPLGSSCSGCGSPCGSAKELFDVRCCWCGSVAHDDCYDSTAVCDFGLYRDSIVPPNCVRLRCIGRVRSRRRVVVSSVSEPSDRPPDTWRPLVVMANRKSGSGHAEHILRDLRGILNPIQVLFLSILFVSFSGNELVRKQRSFQCAALSAWNSLSASVIRSDLLSVFESRLKTFLFHRCFC